VILSILFPFSRKNADYYRSERIRVKKNCEIRLFSRLACDAGNSTLINGAAL